MVSVETPLISSSSPKRKLKCTIIGVYGHKTTSDVIFERSMVERPLNEEIMDDQIANELPQDEHSLNE